jgi:hypothetical protein
VRTICDVRLMALLMCGGGSCSRGPSVAMRAQATTTTNRNQHHHCIATHTKARTVTETLVRSSTSNQIRIIPLTRPASNHQNASRRRSRRRTPFLQTFPLYNILTLPAHRAMHIALQNRQRHCFLTTNFRQPQHSLPIPYPTPTIPPILALPTLAHTPNTVREPQPHTFTA